MAPLAASPARFQHETIIEYPSSGCVLYTERASEGRLLLRTSTEVDGAVETEDRDLIEPGVLNPTLPVKGFSQEHIFRAMEKTL